MGKYIAKRMLMAIGVLIGVSLFIFILLDLAPGDPAKLILGETATPEAVAALREEMGLNRPLLIRWADYIIGIITRGDFGTSYKSGEAVFVEIFMFLTS